MTGIYKITSPTGRVYIGQSRLLGKRLSTYKNLQCKLQPYIYRSLNKYGWDAHEVEIIVILRDDISQEWLDYWEIFFWEYHKGQGINMLNLKKPGSRGRHSEESKQRMSKARKGGTRPDLIIRNKTNPPGFGNPGPSKIVFNTENGIFYKSIKEAAKSIGVTRTTLSCMLRGRTNNWSYFRYA